MKGKVREHREICSTTWMTIAAEVLTTHTPHAVPSASSPLSAQQLIKNQNLAPFCVLHCTQNTHSLFLNREAIRSKNPCHELQRGVFFLVCTQLFSRLSTKVMTALGHIIYSCCSCQGTQGHPLKCLPLPTPARRISAQLLFLMDSLKKQLCTHLMADLHASYKSVGRSLLQTEGCILPSSTSPYTTKAFLQQGMERYCCCLGC